MILFHYNFYKRCDFKFKTDGIKRFSVFITLQKKGFTFLSGLAEIYDGWRRLTLTVMNVRLGVYWERKAYKARDFFEWIGMESGGYFRKCDEKEGIPTQMCGNR